MKLTWFTDYTLRVLIYLALEPSRRATIKEIAQAYGISVNHLMKVVHQLALGGVIESTRGKGGGIRLALPPEEIRVGQVVKVAEGEAPIVECFSDDNHCLISSRCELARVLTLAFAALYQTLDEYTLADLVAKRGKLMQILREPSAHAREPHHRRTAGDSARS